MSDSEASMTSDVVVKAAALSIDTKLSVLPESLGDLQTPRAETLETLESALRGFTDEFNTLHIRFAEETRKADSDALEALVQNRNATWKGLDAKIQSVTEKIVLLKTKLAPDWFKKYTKAHIIKHDRSGDDIRCMGCNGIFYQGHDYTDVTTITGLEDDMKEHQRKCKAPSEDSIGPMRDSIQI